MYKTTFASTIKPVISKSKDIYLARASLEQLRELIPQLDENLSYDTLSFAANLFNINKFNKNDDGVGTEESLAFYKSFIFKPVNLDHQRNVIRGTILSSHLTEFGTDKVIDEETAKSTKGPFNVTIGAILWRVVDESLAELIEDSNNILSDAYNKIHLSFEVGFSDYEIYKIKGDSRNFEDGELVKDKDEKEDLTQYLRAFGGIGKTKSGDRVYRRLTGDLIGLGVGLVENPAGFVGPIAVDKAKKEESETSSANITIAPGSTFTITNPHPDSNICVYTSDNKIEIVKQELNPKQEDETASRQELLSVLASYANKISHSENLNVIPDKQLIVNNSILRKHMKINSIKDINDDLLKEATASSIVDFIETELKVASEKFVKEKQEKETIAQEVQKKHDELIKTHEELVKQLEELKANLQKLESEKIAREKQEKYTARMASFEDKYELSEDELAVVGSQIKDLNDDQFTKVEASLSVLLKGKDKEVLAHTKKTQKTQETQASETPEQTKKEVVDGALDKAEKTSKEVAATSTTTSQTLKEKYQKAFAPDQFVFTK